MKGDNSGYMRRPVLLFVVGLAGIALAAWILTTIYERKQEARTPFVPVVDGTERSTDPTPWGWNWPRPYEGYLATAGDKYYGGSSAIPASELETTPWLRRLYADYAFSLDYRKARGHAYMLDDQRATERVTEQAAGWSLPALPRFQHGDIAACYPAEADQLRHHRGS